MNPAVDYRGTALTVGQTVTYFDPEDKRLHTGEVKLVADEQLVLGRPGMDASLVLMNGRLTAAKHGQPGEVRYSAVVVVPEGYRPAQA
jgi:hypothetical protein